MKGWVDLHCHFLPNIDDGVHSTEEGLALCRGLYELGFDCVLATPHIRREMWPENCRSTINAAFERFARQVQERQGPFPKIACAAEHFIDDLFWPLWLEGEAALYPGNKALLAEFSNIALPLGIDKHLFEMRVKGCLTAIAHPERYFFEARKTLGLNELHSLGYPFVLDLMALVGKYGKYPQKQAEHFLEKKMYFAACSDTHRPHDLDTLALAIERFEGLVGTEEAFRLLSAHPRELALV